MEITTTSLLFLAIGAVVGGALAYFMGSRGEGGRSAQEAEKELEEYRARVTEHFAGTARAVNRMTDSYREVFEQLQIGASGLVDEDKLKNLLAGESGETFTLQRIGYGPPEEETSGSREPESSGASAPQANPAAAAPGPASGSAAAGAAAAGPAEAGPEEMAAGSASRAEETEDTPPAERGSAAEEPVAGADAEPEAGADADGATRDQGSEVGGDTAGSAAAQASSGEPSPAGADEDDTGDRGLREAPGGEGAEEDEDRREEDPEATRTMSSLGH